MHCATLVLRFLRITSDTACAAAADMSTSMLLEAAADELACPAIARAMSSSRPSTMARANRPDWRYEPGWDLSVECNEGL